MTPVILAHNSVGRTDHMALPNCKIQGKGEAGKCDAISNVIGRQPSALAPFRVGLGSREHLAKVMAFCGGPCPLTTGY